MTAKGTSLIVKKLTLKQKSGQSKKIKVGTFKKEFTKSGKNMQDLDPTNMDPSKLQGFSQKQLRKLAKKYGKKLRL